MMLTIHGLPISVKYHDLKSLIKERCNISDFILDNLVSEGDGTKKVRIGVADESEGSYLMKSLNGFRLMGNILSVVPVGKAPPTNPAQNYNQQGGYPSRNNYPTQSGPDYNNRPMNPMDRPDIRPVPQSDPWNQNQGDNSWGPRQNQGPGPNQSLRPNNMAQQPMQQNNYNNYDQQGSQGMNSSYGQQNPNQRGIQQQPYDQRDQYQSRGPLQNQGYYPKSDGPDGPRRAGDTRSHVLRSVEIVDEPLGRPAPAPAPARYPSAGGGGGGGEYEQQKPITIMKDNFQGPQYNVDRPSQPSFQGHSGPQGHLGPQGHSGPPGPHRGPTSGPGHPMQSSEASSWAQKIAADRLPIAKPNPFDRKYPEPTKPLNIGGYGKPGPRFSPRRDVAVDALGRRLPSPGKAGILMTPGRRLPSPLRRMPSPGRRLPSPVKRLPSPGRRMPSPGRRMPSPGRRMPSPGRRMPSPGRRMPSPGRRMPSPGRRMPSPGRRMPSPGRRMPSPGRRMPSPGRRMPSPGRRMPSPGRRMPSPGRRMPSPGRLMPSISKRISPGRRMSPGPGRRHDSPPRRPLSPHKRHDSERYSPTRHLDKTGDKFDDRIKDVRPAYDSVQASNQAYSGGYRPSLHQNVQYPIPGLRQPEQRVPVWQDRAQAKKEDARMAKFDPREEDKRSRSPRKSRSPIRRDRSPPRDRYKKHSPSPRSPRRSWALEKRRSPGPPSEAPPPPMWPADRDEFRRFPEHDAKPKHVPVWEPRRPEDERRFDERRQEARREPSPPPPPPPRDRLPRQPRFEPREEPKRFDRDFHHRPEDTRRSREDLREELIREDDRKREDARKIVKIPDTISKEFEDVYNRTLEFKKRTEELRSKGRSHEREKDFERFDRHERSRERRDASPPADKVTWKLNKDRLSPTLRAKRDKAALEISKKIIDKLGTRYAKGTKERMLEEMKLIVGKKLQDMFGNSDVSFIEMVVKFEAKCDTVMQTKMFGDVIACLPSHLRAVKRPSESTKSEVPKKKVAHNIGNKVPEWQPNDLSSGMQVVLPPPTVQIPNPGLMTYDMMQQMMVAQPLVVPPSYAAYDHSLVQNQMAPQQPMQAEYRAPQQRPANDFQEASDPEPKEEIYNLYLCKDDFEAYTDTQAEYLRRFLVSQLMNAASSQYRGGWTPDFTVKGLQSNFRYEVVARDNDTKEWLLNLNFGEFALFNVLVYTKEEMWYERAAVWLPGHSRFRALEPLEKLKLQNRKLEGVNVGKWKFVKKIVTVKGTRVYVDMPPSSARALEKHKMLLSFELQKVSVFLKAVAVDKEAFDAGLREPSLNDDSEIATAVQNSPMPSIGNDPNIIKLCLKGNKAFNIGQARKVKEMIIYRIFRHHQDKGEQACKTDFIKFGFSQPGYFCILPENEESRTWLLNLDIGRLNRHEITIVGGDLGSIKYIKMTLFIRRENSANGALVFERLKQSNQGVKGLNFGLWKNFKPRNPKYNRGIFLVEMDLESIETIMNMNYKLDYVDDSPSGRLHSDSIAKVSYEENTKDRLSTIIKKLKAEMTDSYDVANMDIASSDDDEDIVYMGEFRV